MVKSRHYIEVPKDVKAFLVRTFSIDERTVRNALTYVSDSPLALRIRSLAIQKGGVEMVVLPVEELEKKKNTTPARVN